MSTTQTEPSPRADSVPPTRLVVYESDLHQVGLALLSIGTGLYAAGLSSVRAVKLSTKLDVTA